MFKKAFTLAEILVVLMVIAVIAAICIPVVIQNTQQADNIATLKRTYNTLNSAFNNIITNTGDLTGVFANATAVQSGFTPYLTTVKTCAVGSIIGNCWASNVYDYNGTDITSSFRFNEMSAMTLNNGVNVAFSFASGSQYCTSTWSAEMPGGNVCALIYIDVNGNKGPNKLGVDVFAFWLMKDKIMPVGSSNDAWSNQSIRCTSSDDGRGCAAKYILNDTPASDSGTTNVQTT